MKSAASAILLAMTLATAAAAQEQTPSLASPPPASPDYSRDSLMRIFSVDETAPERRRSIEFHPGWIDFRLLGTRVRFSPFFAPLQGSEHRINREWPDPFSLTGAEIAQTPETFRRTRASSAELRALERRIRETSKVKVSGQQ